MTEDEYYFTRVLKDFERIEAFFTARAVGSLSLKNGEEFAVNFKNRQRLFDVLRQDLKRAVFCQQTHSDHIFVVGKGDTGRGSESFESGIPDTDALLTDVSGTTLMILVADCVPILLYDPAKKVIGAVHAGWRGTMKHILEKAVQKMSAQYGSNPKDIVAEIGPSIGPDCFEVGEEVVNSANEANLADFILHKNGKIYFDLWESNKAQLVATGVTKENIKISAVCNHCSPDYFSFRRDKDTRRFGAGIVLK